VVAYCSPAMPGTSTTVDYGNDGTATTTWTPYIIVTSTDYCRDPRTEKEEEEKAKELARAKQEEHMRSFWKQDQKRHQFRQKKWSMDKPKGRKRHRN